MLACLVALGCATDVEPGPQRPNDDDAVAMTEQRIMAGQSYASCTGAERSELRSAAIRGRVYVSSLAFEQCLDRTMRDGDGWYGPYVPFRGDPPAADMNGYVAQALAAARSSTPAVIECEDLEDGRGGEAALKAFLHTHPDRLSLDDGFLAGEQSLEDVVWHEVMHTHGYAHLGAAEIGQGAREGFVDTVPFIVGHCVGELLAKTRQACGSRLDVCPKGALIPVIASYPDGKRCSCARDPLTRLPDGMSSPTDPPTPILDAGEADDFYAKALAIGDFNGDELQDLAVGAPGEDSGAGAVYLYEGTPEGLFPRTRLGYSALGRSLAGSEVGASLAAADFDDDGYDDLAVGAPGRASDQGRVFLVAGGPDGLGTGRTLDQSGLGEDEDGDRFGHALVERWDGTGYGLVVSAPGEKIGDSAAASGYVFVFESDPDTLLAPVTGFGQAGVANERDEQDDLFGWSLASGRIDGDFTDDIVVGAPGEDVFTGAAYVFLSEHGNTHDFPNRYELAAPADAVAGRAGTSVAVGRFLEIDFNSVAVGIPYWDLSSWNGGVALYDGRRIVPEPAPRERLRAVWRGAAPAGLAGYALATVPARSGMVANDLAVAAPLAGEVALLAWGGGTTLFARQVLSQTGLDAHEPGDHFGSALATGSGLEFGRDLVVGAPGEAPDGGQPSGAGALFQYRARYASWSFEPAQFHVQDE